MKMFEDRNQAMSYRIRNIRKIRGKISFLERQLHRETEELGYLGQVAG